MDEQAIQDKVKEYLEKGLTETEMLNALKENDDVTITYMELKFILSDLDEIVEKERDTLDDLNAEKAKLSEEVDQARAAMGATSVSVDETPAPGTRLSGSANLASGATIKWGLSDQGQLGLMPGGTGEATEEDMVEFQRELQSAIQKKMGIF